MSEGLQYHIKCKPGDIGEYVLLPGDPKRVPKIAELWDEAWKVAENREYVVYTGYVDGIKVSACSTGIGGPSTAIAVEELARCGAHTLIRVGTSGSFQDHVEVGDLVITTGAVRFEGTTKTYVMPEYPAVAHYEVVLALIEACKKLGYRFHVGITRTSDGFYSCHPEPGGSFRNYWQSWMKELFMDFRRANVLNAEMEAAVVLTLCNLFGLRGGAVCVVLDKIFEVVGKGFAPEKQFRIDEEIEMRVCKAGVEAIKILYKWDQLKKEKGEEYFYPSLLLEK